MLGTHKVGPLIILALAFTCATILVRPVSAGYPTVSNVIVWSQGADTVLNATVSHSPQTPSHYLDRIEVNIDGDNRIFPVAYRPETTFVVQCNLGTIAAPTNATVRAHCIIDGYSLSLYGPTIVPEFSTWGIFLALVLMIVPILTFGKRLTFKL